MDTLSDEERAEIVSDATISTVEALVDELSKRGMSFTDVMIVGFVMRRDIDGFNIYMAASAVGCQKCLAQAAEKHFEDAMEAGLAEMISGGHSGPHW